MSRFGDDVEYAAASLPKVWRLLVFSVPDRLGGLLSRHGFSPTKKNPTVWWRTFSPATDRDEAEIIRSTLLAAGLKGKWDQVTKKDRPWTPGSPSLDGFGGTLNATPIAGSWRRKTRRG